MKQEQQTIKKVETPDLSGNSKNANSEISKGIIPNLSGLNVSVSDSPEKRKGEKLPPKQTGKVLRMKKDDTPYLSNFGKNTRSVIRFNNNQREQAGVENFGTLVNAPGPITLLELINEMRPTGSATYVPPDVSGIKPNKDGSINKTTLKKPWKAKYVELENLKKQELQRQFDEKFAEPRDFTIPELVLLDEKSKSIKKPYRGKII